MKGPLTVTDMICWHVGMGMGLYGVKALRLAYRNRQRIPRFYLRDDLGVPDVQQRVHWDPELARRIGNPSTYDYGRMRETWLVHLCTDWMGDDAWLWKLECEFRLFNYVGDTHRMQGLVTRRYLAPGDRPAVDLEIWGENQRGVVTCPGHGDDPVAEPGARTGTTPGPARRRHRPPGGARGDRGGVRAPVTGYEGADGVDAQLDGSVLRLTLDRARTRNSVDAEMMLALIRQPRGRRPGRGGAGRPAHRRRRRLLRGRRHRRPQRPGAGPPPGRGHPAPSPRTGAPPDPAGAVGAGPDRVPRFGDGPPASGSTSPSRPTSAWPGGARASGSPSSSAGSRPTAAARGCSRASSGSSGRGELLLLGRELSGEEAADWGLVHRCVADDDVDAVAEDLVRRLAAAPTVAVGLTKWLMYSGAALDLDGHLRNEAFALELSSRSQDFKEGLAAFREKRDPRFTGQ